MTAFYLGELSLITFIIIYSGPLLWLTCKLDGAEPSLMTFFSADTSQKFL